MEKDPLANPRNVRFKDLLALCVRHFGECRIRGDHHIFRTGWRDNPIINLQPDKGMAIPYQVRQVQRALERKRNESEAGDIE